MCVCVLSAVLCKKNAPFASSELSCSIDFEYIFKIHTKWMNGKFSCWNDEKERKKCARQWTRPLKRLVNFISDIILFLTPFFHWLFSAFSLLSYIITLNQRFFPHELQVVLITHCKFARRNIAACFSIIQRFFFTFL